MNTDRLTATDATRLAFRFAGQFGKGDGSLEALAEEVRRVLGGYPLSAVEASLDRLIETWEERTRPRLAAWRRACQGEMARRHERQPETARGGDRSACCGEPWTARPWPVAARGGGYTVRWRDQWCGCLYARAVRLYWGGNAAALEALAEAGAERPDVREALREVARV